MVATGFLSRRSESPGLCGRTETANAITSSIRGECEPFEAGAWSLGRNARPDLKFTAASLIPETNPECTRSANEISVGTHDFDLAYSVTNLNCADMRSGERNHFSKLTGSN